MFPSHLIRQFPRRLAQMSYVHLTPSSPDYPILCYIPGFRSTYFQSKKCKHLYQFARENGYGFIAWDHLEDDNEASVARWFEDSRDILSALHPRDRLVVTGASMGAWIALLLARTPLFVKAIVGIGTSVDSTERLLEEAPTQDPTYVWKRPSVYSSSGYYPIRISFLLDSRPVLLLNDPTLNIPCPVHMIHGAKDFDSPLSHAKYLQNRLGATLDVVPDGDHRLSKDSDLDQLKKTLLLYL